MSAGYPLGRNKSEIAQKLVFVPSIWSWFRALTHPHCPACKGEMVFRYQMPDDYQEVSPKYYECSQCHNGYCRTFGGSWIAISLSDIPKS